MSPVTGISPPQSAQQAVAAGSQICEEINKIRDIYKKRKFPLEGKGSLSFTDFMKSFIPASATSMFSVGTIEPKEIPFLSSSMAGASVLMDAGAGNSMMALFSSAGQVGISQVTAVVGNIQNDISNFASAMTQMRPTSFDINAIAGASQSISNLLARSSPTGLNSPSIQQELFALCNSLGGTSSSIFGAFDALGIIQTTIGDLGTAMSLPTNLFTSAGNLLSSADTITKTRLQLAMNGAGRFGSLETLFKTDALKRVNFTTPCSPTAIEELSVLRGTCLMIDDFYNSTGLGVVDWGQVASDFAVAAITPDLLALVDRVNGFSQPDPTKITNRLASEMDLAMRDAFCHGGRAETVNRAVASVAAGATQALALASTVATLYESGAQISQSVAGAISAMNQAGAAGAIQSLVQGDLGKFMDQGALDVLGLSSEIKALQECAKQQKDPVVAAVLQQEIKKAVDEQNLKGYLKSSYNDSNKFFIKAKKLRDIYAKTNNFQAGQGG